tara:strand:+ start:26 stop:388 length:363 start_codon:yes stop_codon:yes gene_type:complete
MDKLQNIIQNPKVYISVSVLVVLYLIIVLINALSETKYKQWPPFGMVCPDYWTSSRSDNGYICTMDPKNPNKPLNANFTNNVVSFTDNDTIFTKGTAKQNLNEKKAWANSANIFWDGSQN